jgi:hypothetical protein
MRGGWVLEADIRDFFGALDHTKLREIQRLRVQDGVVLRSLGKWLQAGVLENGRHHRPASGTPQGGVISPLLANVYLHEVLDLWFHREVLPRLRGRAFLVRYADDFVIAFAREDDALCVHEVLPKRFAGYGLELHPEKTRLLDFRRPRYEGGDDPESFDLLGFTHYWGKSRRGASVIKRWYHEGTASPCSVCDVSVVSWSSPRSDRGAACSAESAASRALCVLRDNRERAVASCFPIRGAADLAQVEALAVEQGTQDMGVVDAALGAVSSTSGLRGSFDLSSRSEPVIRGAGCGSSASPDLWEAGESDLPGPPDMLLRSGRGGEGAPPPSPSRVSPTFRAALVQAG